MQIVMSSRTSARIERVTRYVAAMRFRTLLKVNKRRSRVTKLRKRHFVEDSLAGKAIDKKGSTAIRGFLNSLISKSYRDIL